MVVMMTMHDVKGLSPALLMLWFSVGTLFTERGTIATVFIICYALTSVVGGYVR